MRITTKHSGSSYGQPVILDADGNVMDARPGLRAVLDHLGWTSQDLAAAAGISVSSCQKFGTDRPVPAAVLNVLADALEE